MAAAVEVVELALGDAVVDVDGGEEKRAGFLHFVEAMHAGGGFFGDALHFFSDFVPALVVLLEALGGELEDFLEFFVVGGVRGGDFAVLFELDALVNQQGGVAAVVDDLIGAFAVAEIEGALGAPPVFFQVLALPGEDGNALRIGGRAFFADGHRRGGVVLRAEDIAGAPANFGAQGGESFDEHGGLDRHVQRSHDPQTFERLGGRVFLADCHQSGHLLLGEHNFLAAPVGEREVFDLEFDFPGCGLGRAFARWIGQCLGHDFALL